MIKVQGLGRRRPGLTHAECIEHHRTVHSKLGVGQADHMGKYVLYYFKDARASDGSVIEDLPWDMSALEWFLEDEYWFNFQNWLESAPDGQEVAMDEASFLERDRCYMCPYEESVIVDQNTPAAAAGFVRLLKLKDGQTFDSAMDYHRNVYAPALQNAFGSSMQKYVANHIVEATRLSTGRIPEKPVDIIEIFKLDADAFGTVDEFVKALGNADIAAAEATVFDRSASVVLSTEEVIYLA